MHSTLTAFRSSRLVLALSLAMWLVPVSVFADAPSAPASLSGCHLEGDKIVIVGKGGQCTIYVHGAVPTVIHILPGTRLRMVTQPAFDIKHDPRAQQLDVAVSDETAIGDVTSISLDARPTYSVTLRVVIASKASKVKAHWTVTHQFTEISGLGAETPMQGGAIQGGIYLNYGWNP